jgi:hypothetical protein
LVCKHSYKHGDKRTTRDEDRVRDIVSNKTDCQVRIKVNERPNNLWDLRWMEGRTIHNHTFNDPSAYSEHRTLQPHQRRIILANHASGILLSRTKASLEAQDPVILITSRDLYNKYATMARDLRKGKEANEALIYDLVAAKQRGEVYFEYIIDEFTHRIQKIFLADTR